MHPETLRTLAAAVSGRIVGDASVEIRDVTHDSRQARPGSLFVAIRGAHFDGHQFVTQAAASGAAAIAVETETDLSLPQLIVDSTRGRLGRLASRVHGRPSRHVRVAGITGTNGKTTVAHLLESIFAAAGLTPGRIGTTGARSAGRQIDIGHTTPEASDLHRLLAQMRDDGVEAVAMEVSSHALALGRVEEVEFAVAAFTNLSQDHLDFHRTMDDYFAAKRELFHHTDRAVINTSGEWGRRLVDALPDRVEVVEVGPSGNVIAETVTHERTATSFDLVTPAGRTRVRLPLAGEFNVGNALVASGVAFSLGLPLDATAAGLAAAPPVPGRFEVITSTHGTVIVDYAHTPEAIETAIQAARDVTSGKIIAVFGAGGDRDREKRPLMAAAACRADEAFLTNDNPRSEDPDEIARQVLAGAPAGCDITVELDRRRALELAVARCGPDDTVLLLGKGHESGQTFADRTEPFDDRAEAARALGANA